MAKKAISTKQLLINKANAQMVLASAIAAFLVIFSLVASRALLGQRGYQARVITEKEKAVKQLKANVKAVGELATAYTNFESTAENIIGGNPKGTGDRDGANAKIVLDALPSQYDFPALATSLEKILTDPSYKINSITGTDDELNQQNTTSPTPVPIEMPFQITVSGAYGSMQNLVGTLERSIRPFQVSKLDFSGKDSNIQATVSAKTFYQPAKNLTIKTKEIK